MAEYVFDQCPKIPLAFEPFLPPQNYSYAQGIEYSAAAQEVFVRNWQKLMNDNEPTRTEYESGAWGCNTDIIMRPVFTVILGSKEPTQRDAALATSMVKWLATYPGQNLVKLGRHLQQTIKKDITKLTKPNWPDRDSDEGRLVSGLRDLLPDTMFALWASEQNHTLSARTWSIVPDWESRPHSQVDAMNTAEFIALEPSNFSASGDMVSLPNVTSEDRQTFDAVARWLGTKAEDFCGVQNMVGGTTFLDACFKDIAELASTTRPVPEQAPEAAAKPPAP